MKKIARLVRNPDCEAEFWMNKIGLLRLYHLYNYNLRVPLSPTGYKKRTGQFLRALHVYSIDNFVAF